DLEGTDARPGFARGHGEAGGRAGRRRHRLPRLGGDDRREGDADPARESRLPRRRGPRGDPSRRVPIPARARPPRPDRVRALPGPRGRRLVRAEDAVRRAAPYLLFAGLTLACFWRFLFLGWTMYDVRTLEGHLGMPKEPPGWFESHRPS